MDSSILVGVNDDGTIVDVNPNKAETLKANIIDCINNSEPFFLFCPYLLHTSNYGGWRQSRFAT